MTLSQIFYSEGRIIFYFGIMKNMTSKNSFWDTSEQATNSDPLPTTKATERHEREIWVKIEKTQPQSSTKHWPVTGWPLVVCWRLTQTAQSFPYRRLLPGPAGFDINTSPWLTEALALGWAPGASPVHSALLLACWFTVPSGCSLIHFPSQFAHRAPRKPSSCNIFALWFPEEPVKKNKPPLTAPVPVNVQRAARPPLVSATGEKSRGPRCHRLHVDLPFPTPSPTWPSWDWAGRR